MNLNGQFSKEVQMATEHILRNKGNANQSNTDILSHPSQNNYLYENKQQQLRAKIYMWGWEMGTIIHFWWACKLL
jgi:hypothetical protein